MQLNPDFKCWLFALLSLIISLSLAGCNSDGPSKWDTYQEPIKPSELAADLAIKSIAKLWKIDVGSGAEDGYALLMPALIDDSIVIASRSGTVLRIDADRGTKIWRNQLKSHIFSGVATDGSVVIVTFDNSDVQALDFETGEVLWSHTMGQQISAVPAVGSGRAVIRMTDGTVSGLDSRSGELIWSYQRSTPGLSLHGDPAAVISSDAVLTGFANGKLVISSLINGRVFWEKILAVPHGRNEIERLNDVETQPIVAINSIFAATYQGDIVAMRLQDSSEVWRSNVSTRLPMSRSQDVLYVTTALGSVVAIDEMDGRIIWQQDALQGYGVSMPLVVAQRVVVGDSHGNLYLLNSADGSLLGMQAVSHGAVLSLLESGGNILVYTASGSLSAHAL